MNKKKLIFICTANSCESQIAEGLLNEMASDFLMFLVLARIKASLIQWHRGYEKVGIDISSHRSESISKYLNIGIDIIVTVCDNAKANCPTFPGNVQRLLEHQGSRKKSKILKIFNARDDIKKRVMEQRRASYETI